MNMRIAFKVGCIVVMALFGVACAESTKKATEEETSTENREEGFIHLKASTGDAAFVEAKTTPGWNRNISVIYQYAGNYYLRLNDLWSEETNSYVADPPLGYRVLDTDCLPSTWTAALC